MPPIFWKKVNIHPVFRLFFLLLLTIYPIFGQYRIDNWTPDNGLPQNSIYAMKQTRDGYLWLATVDGLVRFDGIHFTVFNTSNTPGITSNRFVSLLEDASGDLWAGTEENGIVRIREGKFRTYTTADGLETNTAIALVTDADGNVAVSLIPYQKVFRRFDGEKFVPYDPESEFNKDWYYDPTHYALCGLMLDSKTLGCLSRGKSLVVEDPLKPRAFTVISGKGVMEETGAVWGLFPDSPLRKIELDGKTTVLENNSSYPGDPVFMALGRERISLISKDKNGALWLTDMKARKTELLSADSPAGLNHPTFAYEDSEGSLWVGTMRSGLFRFRKQVITTYLPSEKYSDSDNFYPIYQDKRGTIWAGAFGLFKYENGNLQLIKGSENSSVYSIGELPDGRLMLSLYTPSQGEDGVYVLENGKIEKILKSKGLPTSFYVDGEGAVWIGIIYSGLLRLKDGQTTEFLEKDGLAANDVKVIIGDGAGGMWIGSYGGLTHYKDGKFTKWVSGQELPVRTIRSLYLDSENVLWIGSYDNGLARFKDGKFTHYTSKDGLFTDSGFQILEDDRRNLWLSSNRGIYRVRKDELNEFAEGKHSAISSIAYGKADGMRNAESNGGRAPAGIKARDGRLWFPTIEGIAVVNPENIRVNPNPPPVVIEDFKIDNKTIGSENVYSAIHKPDTVIQIQPNQQNFEIQYTALSFINSENIRFKYKLDGIDTEWAEAGTRRTAYFSYIPPGDYTFRVIAANADGVWNDTGQSIKIRILPVFYRTWWFYLLTALTVAGLFFLLYRWRIAQIEGQRLVQQNFSRQLIASQEAERKRIAAELHDGLGQRLVVIKNLIWMTINGKENNNLDNLEEISDEASQAISEVKAISYNLRPYQLDRMGLTRAIEGIIRSAKNSSEIDFSLEIDNIDNYFPKEMEINFYRIIQESVNNILKHSEASKAEIKIRKAENTLEIKISDNGRGFELQENLLNPQMDLQHLQTSGFGLIGIRERIDLLGGKAEINSAPGRGTELKITIIK